MTHFQFETITAAQALGLESDDVVTFASGPATSVSVVFGEQDGTSTVAITFDGHTVVFGPGVIVASTAHNLVFPDGSTLIMGGPRTEEFDGGPGNDALFGGDGADTLNGHGGANLLQGNQGDDVLTAGTGADTIYGGQGADSISSGSGAAGEAGDFAEGNKGDDTLAGGAGPDTLLGGQGDDVILGGAGDDLISGDRGSDTLTGGAGADVFHVTDDGGTDRITDFNAAEGDRVEVDPGTMFDITQLGQDTVVTFADGGQVVLAGVELDTLRGDWIFGA